MKEIKAGEYVRTQDGKIDKVIEISGEYILLKNNFKITEFRESRIYFKIKDITKHNPNLTKVLETGDIIEHKIYQEIFKSEIYITNNDEIFTTDGERILPEEIISVVTHEQFNQVKYEV